MRASVPERRGGVNPARRVSGRAARIQAVKPARARVWKSDREGFPAAAGTGGVRVLEAEAGPAQVLSVVDAHARQVHGAHRVDDDVEAVLRHDRVVVVLVVEREGVLEAGAAAALDVQAQRLPLRAGIALQELLDAPHGTVGDRDHRTLAPRSRRPSPAPVRISLSMYELALWVSSQPPAAGRLPWTWPRGSWRCRRSASRRVTSACVGRRRTCADTGCSRRRDAPRVRSRATR